MPQLLPQNRPLSVREAVINSVTARYEGGRLDRATWLNRQAIADEAVEEIGDEVPDTAIGSATIQAWVRNRLEEMK